MSYEEKIVCTDPQNHCLLSKVAAPRDAEAAMAFALWLERTASLARALASELTHTSGLPFRSITAAGDIVIMNIHESLHSL